MLFCVPNCSTNYLFIIANQTRKIKNLFPGGGKVRRSRAGVVLKRAVICAGRARGVRNDTLVYARFYPTHKYCDVEI